MPSAGNAPTPEFLKSVERLIEDIDQLHDNQEALELAALRLNNMISTQRQWQRRLALGAARHEMQAPMPAESTVLERLVQAQARCQTLLLRASSDHGEV